MVESPFNNIQSYAGTGNIGIATTSKGNVTVGPSRVVKCYNCQGEGHMARQCTQPKRPRNDVWFKEKLMLAEAQEAAFQTDDLDVYDSDCDDLSSAKAVLIANLSSCDPEVLSETQDAVIQDTTPSAPNDLLVLSLVEQMTDHVAHLDMENQTNKMSLKKESKYIDKEIILEKQNKELGNIICKMYRSTQAMHMLTKPQVFYDDTHKQALGYQNPFHLKKAQRIQPTLYDGSVIAKEHAVISVNDDEETLILKEESRSKMLDKQNDPVLIEKKIKISPIDYLKLNKIKEAFGKFLSLKKNCLQNKLFG
ncbi:retrovirus-related pol polyprotein from transposon TNT 1-94 [Tanacetum coccineum]